MCLWAAVVVLLGLVQPAAATRFDELEWYRYIALVLIGALVGFIGGYAGIGGAPFMVGLLRLFVKFCQHEAQGTVLAVMLPPMSLMAVLVMKDRAKVLWRICVPAFVGYATMSYLGAMLAFLMDDSVLSYVFGAFLVVLGVRYGKQFLQRKAQKAALAAVELAQAVNPNAESSAPEDSEAKLERAKEEEEREKEMDNNLNPLGPTVAEGAMIPFNYLTSGTIGGLIGVVGGLFGIGAGVLMVPVFTEWCGVHKDDARTLSLLILLPPVSIGAVIKYAQEDSIDWPMAGVLFALYFVSNAYGAKKGRDASTTNFKMVMGTLLAVLGAFIIVTKRFDNPMGEECD